MAKFSNLALLEVRNRLDSWPLCKKNLVGSHWVVYLTIVTLTIIYTVVILPHIYIFEITSIAKHQQQIVSSVLYSKVGLWLQLGVGWWEQVELYGRLWIHILIEMMTLG